MKGGVWYATNNTTDADKESFNKWNSYLKEVETSHSPGETEGLLLKEGFSTILKNPVVFTKWALNRFPKFWITSHSSMFGIDKPNSEYMEQRAYITIVIKLALFSIHCILVVLTIFGLIASLRSNKTARILFVLLFYCTLYIFLDTPNRHHVPYMPYMILLAASVLSKIFPSLEKKLASI